MKSNKMIQKIGEKQDPHEYMRQSTERLLVMENLASTHIGWYTHKNPYGCWICDLIQLCYSQIQSFGEFLGPELEEQDTMKQSLSEQME